MRKTKSIYTTHAVVPYLFIIPFLVFFVVFSFVPLLMSIGISFTKWDYVSPMEWYGFDNYKVLLGMIGSGKIAEDFKDAILHTLLFVVVETPLLIVLPMLVALLIVRCKKVKKFSMGFFYFPTLLSISTVCILWGFFFDTNAGIINHFIGKEIPWITQLPYAWISIFILSTWWGVGGNMILYVAALSNVPPELYEAADLDGANSIRKFFSITLPSVKPTLAYTIVMTTIGSFNMLGQSQVLTAGGPNSGTKTAMMIIYETAFGGKNNFGRACAMSLLFGLIMMAFTITAYRLQMKNAEE